MIVIAGPRYARLTLAVLHAQGIDDEALVSCVGFIPLGSSWDDLRMVAKRNRRRRA